MERKRESEWTTGLLMSNDKGRTDLKNIKTKSIYAEFKLKGVE
jgi:hypothetical protein